MILFPSTKPIFKHGDLMSSSQNVLHGSTLVHSTQQKPDGSQARDRDGQRESPAEEETNECRPSEDEGNGASHDPTSAKTGSPKGVDRGGNSRSSIKAHQGDERDSHGTAGLRDPSREPCRSRRSADVVLTTLHVFPRTEREEQWRSSNRMLPNLKTD